MFHCPNEHFVKKKKKKRKKKSQISSQNHYGADVNFGNKILFGHLKSDSVSALWEMK